MKMVLMMSKVMHHVNHWFKLSPEFLSFALGVVYRELHVNKLELN